MVSIKKGWRQVVGAGFGVCIGLIMVSARAEAFVMFSEILADPPTGISGDANGDGVALGAEDEFVEIYNHSADEVDLTGWSISDALKVRHVFHDRMLLPGGGACVVFGGGVIDPSASLWYTASTGGLGLNNTGDTVVLTDAEGRVIDLVVYGAEAGQDRSIVRLEPRRDSSWVASSSIGSGQVFSPGVVDFGTAGTTVPEPATLMLLVSGTAAAWVARRKRNMIV